MKWLNKMGAVASALTLMGTLSAADHDSNSDDLERAGTCSDAKLQVEYFCNKENSANDTMVQVGTACRNAKVNFKAACKGIADADSEYKFED